MLTIEKPERYRSDKYKRFLRTLPCCKCGRSKSPYLDVAPAHQELYKAGSVGSKSDDLAALPLCTECHRLEHQTGVKTFWKNIDRQRMIYEHLKLYIGRLESAPCSAISSMSLDTKSM